MKRIIKNNIFGFILGLLVAGTVGVFAYSYVADQISYTTDKNENIKSVGQALNDLYEKSNNEFNIFYYTGTNYSTFTHHDEKFRIYTYRNKFKYLKITQADAVTNGCSGIYFSDKHDQTAGTLEMNRDYLLNNLSDVLVVSTTGSNGCFYLVNINLHN